MNERRHLLAAAGATLAVAAGAHASAYAGTRRADPDDDTLYGHGMVWNRELPGLAGRLNLAFDLRLNLKTGRARSASASAARTAS